MLEDLPDGGRDILIFLPSQAWRSPDNSDSTPKPAVHLREFEGDVAAAYDNQVTRNGVHVHYGAVGKVRDSIDTRHLRRHCTATHVDEYPIRREPLRADAYRVRGLEACVSLVNGAVCHTSQPLLDAGSRLPRDRVFPGFDALHVNADRTIANHSKFGCATNHMGCISTRDHSLRRYAAGIHTRAAEQVALNDRNLHSRPS